MDGTLNLKQKANDHLSMYNTTFQVLAQATPHFDIRTDIDKSLTGTTP